MPVGPDFAGAIAMVGMLDSGNGFRLSQWPQQNSLMSLTLEASVSSKRYRSILAGLGPI